MGEERDILTRKELTRSTFLKGVGALGLSATFAGSLLDQDAALARSVKAAGSITPIRPPATPLVVRNPYVSTWMTSDTPVHVWPTFWNGSVKAVTGMARVDGTSYIFMGDPTNIGDVRTMRQAGLEITATRSIYTFEGGGISLSVEFLSPVEAGDMRRLSVPFSYVNMSAHGTDKKSHEVSLYLDISGEWAHGDSNAEIVWSREKASSNTILEIMPSNPQVLREVNEYPAWGTAVLATGTTSGMTNRIGADAEVRSQAVSEGRLDGSIDQNKPRRINDRYPVAAFNFELGSVDSKPTGPVTLAIGHVREPVISYMGEQLPPLWRSYWSSWQQMLGDFLGDAAAALTRSQKLDSKVEKDALQAARGNRKYAALCALSLRQAFGGIELAGTSEKPRIFQKEIGSGSFASTVDVIYPSMPAYLYANPKLLAPLLEPVIEYVESGGWTKEFAPHDLGYYPNANGQTYGSDMPVEESANMLIMAAAYVRFAGGGEVTDYARKHYDVLKQWADYLVANTLDPGFQNQTDDFTGFIAHSSNLALKGIVGVGAMGQIAATLGKDSDAAHYGDTAGTYIKQWVQKSQDESGQHLKLAYDRPGTWSLKYNAFPDRLLGLNLVPEDIEQEESDWYKTQENTYGIPLDIRHTYTKADWEMWTAAATNDRALRNYFINTVYRFADTSPSRVPFTDWYDTVSGRQVGFQARPVIGGVFAILTRRQAKPNA